MRWVTNAIAAAFVLAASAADAQTVEATPAAETIAAGVAPPIIIPAGTSVVVEFTEALSSETSQQEQLFGLRLAEPIVLDGREVVPAGAIGGGEVIDAHPSAFGGRQGRLIVSGRFIEIEGQRARIRSMQIGAAGEDRSGAAITAGILVGIPAYLIQGQEIHIPVGTRATARLAAELSLAPTAPTPVDASTAEPQSTEGENQQ